MKELADIGDMVNKMNGKFILVERVPTFDEYQNLRKAVGWWDVETKATGIGLHNSLFSVCVIFENEVVGCGRVIGDGGIYFYIQYVIMDNYQDLSVDHDAMQPKEEIFKQAKFRKVEYLWRLQFFKYSEKSSKRMIVLAHK